MKVSETVRTEQRLMAHPTSLALTIKSRFGPGDSPQILTAEATEIMENESSSLTISSNVSILGKDGRSVGQRAWERVDQNSFACGCLVRSITLKIRTPGYGDTASAYTHHVVRF